MVSLQRDAAFATNFGAPWCHLEWTAFLRFSLCFLSGWGRMGLWLRLRGARLHSSDCRSHTHNIFTFNVALPILSQVVWKQHLKQLLCSFRMFFHSCNGQLISWHFASKYLLLWRICLMDGYNRLETIMSWWTFHSFAVRLAGGW